MASFLKKEHPNNTEESKIEINQIGTILLNES